MLAPEVNNERCSSRSPLHVDPSATVRDAYSPLDSRNCQALFETLHMPRRTTPNDACTDCPNSALTPADGRIVNKCKRMIAPRRSMTFSFQLGFLSPRPLPIRCAPSPRSRLQPYFHAQAHTADHAIPVCSLTSSDTMGCFQG